jgi:hypothetical protein
MLSRHCIAQLEQDTQSSIAPKRLSHHLGHDFYTQFSSSKSRLKQASPLAPDGLSKEEFVFAADVGDISGTPCQIWQI